jgi:hypothetical protein
MEAKKIFDKTTSDPMYREIKNIEKYNKIKIGDYVKYNRKYVDYSNGINYFGGDYEYDDGKVIDKKIDGANYLILVQNIFSINASWFNIENIYTKNLYITKNDDETSKGNIAPSKSGSRGARKSAFDGSIRKLYSSKVKSVRRTKKSKRKSKRKSKKSKRKSKKSKRKSKKV